MHPLTAESKLMSELSQESLNMSNFMADYLGIAFFMTAPLIIIFGSGIDLHIKLAVIGRAARIRTTFLYPLLLFLDSFNSSCIVACSAS